jgi:heme/copper-type cytochrome/quinol oxidase subunit 1
MIIAVPTGIKVFSWISTIYNSNHKNIRSKGEVTQLFSIAFIILFTIGGITGVILSQGIIDTYLHDTYYIVAHFHYVLSMGAVFSIYTGVYHWFKVIFKVGYRNKEAQIHLYTTFIGVNITFFPQHILGIAGMPRRIPNYPDMYTRINRISTYGSIIIVISITIFIYNLYKSLTNKLTIV